MRSKIYLIPVLLLAILSSSQTTLSAQSDTLFFFDFENLDVETKGDQVISSIKNNHGEFQDAVQRYPSRTVAFGHRSSFRSADVGDYFVGKQFLYHSPSWFT